MIMGIDCFHIGGLAEVYLVFPCLMGIISVTDQIFTIARLGVNQGLLFMILTFVSMHGLKVRRLLLID